MRLVSDSLLTVLLCAGVCHTAHATLLIASSRIIMGVLPRCGTRYNKLINMRYTFGLYGFLLAGGAVALTIGTVELVLIDFDTARHNVSMVARASADLFFLERGCNETGFNSLYAYLLLLIWAPSCFVAALVWPAWLCSLQLGSQLAVDSVEDYIRSLDPRKIDERGLDNEENWRCATPPHLLGTLTYWSFCVSLRSMAHECRRAHKERFTNGSQTLVALTGALRYPLSWVHGFVL